MIDLGSKIKSLIAEQGLDYKEKSKTIYTTCPMCGHNDKFSILKVNGSCICYRGSCEFGKRWFTEWLMLTAGIDYKAAKALMSDYEAQRYIEPDGSLKVILDDQGPRRTVELTPIAFPEADMMRIDSEYAGDARDYLASRGIPLDIAVLYGVMFSPIRRRVIFPVVMGGQVYGYQGRHIDKVDDSVKMRNNDGFAREALVMFADRMQQLDFVIISEGPVDAIKFHYVGSNICTMGKVVTDKQLDLICAGKQSIYLALDDDADAEIRELSQILSDYKVYLIKVPESCRQRCREKGKKADFGECTFEECEAAFHSAIRLDDSYVVINLR